MIAAVPLPTDRAVLLWLFEHACATARGCRRDAALTPVLEIHDVSELMGHPTRLMRGGWTMAGEGQA